MKKIYFVAGVVLFISLLVMVGIFFGDIFDFAQNLEEGAKQASYEEYTQFIGNFETQFIPGDERFIGFNGVYKFNSDGSGTISSLSSTWEVENNQLVIHYYEGISTVTYDYAFFDDDNTLVLSNSKGSLEFTRTST